MIELLLLASSPSINDVASAWLHFMPSILTLSGLPAVLSDLTHTLPSMHAFTVFPLADPSFSTEGHDGQVE